MELVRFKFVDPKDEAKVFLELSRTGSVVSVKEEESEVFIAPVTCLSMLNEAGVRYKILRKETLDSTLQTLRGARTGQLQ